MGNERMTYKTEQYGKALAALKVAAAKEGVGDNVEIDATIQRFEFTFELAWKLLKLYLNDQGIVSATTPRSTLREAFAAGMIEGNDWMEMVDDRNRTSHTYDDALASDIYVRIKFKYLPLFERLAEKIRHAE